VQALLRNQVVSGHPVRMPRVFSYERVSSALQVEQGRGLERQATAADSWCAARGLQIDNGLSDAGISAFKGDNVSKGALGRFLAMAQAGDLGDDPILLVEAIDRLSRQEALDSLPDVLLGLVRAGVTIVSLEDGQEFSRAAIREDGTKLVMLALKAEAAHQYSKRLSKRITAAWKQSAADLAQNKLNRVGVFMPPWCKFDGDRVVLDPDRAAIVRKVFDFAYSDGAQIVASRLNKEGVPGLTDSRPWTRSKVRRLLKDPRVWGAVRLYGREDLSKKELQRRIAEGLEETLFPDLLPLVLPKDEVDGVLAARSSRTSEGAGSGIKGQTWNVAQTFTRCSCGAIATLGITYSGTRKGPDGKPLRLRYARCNAKCGAKGYRLDHLNGHIVCRLHKGQLQQLFAQDSGRGQQIKAEQKAIAVLQVQLALAEQQQKNAARLFKEALLEGRDDPLYREAVEEARMETELKRSALNGSQQRLACLRHEVDTEEFDQAVADLFDAFAKEEDTPVQRQNLNRLMRQAGLRITLDKQEKRVGMSIGDGPIEWQPLEGITVKTALASKTSSARFMDLTVTDAVIEKAIAAGQELGYVEWLKSMNGVRQVAVTSIPPGWHETEIAKAMKKTVESMSPEDQALIREIRKD